MSRVAERQGRGGLRPRRRAQRRGARARWRHLRLPTTAAAACARGLQGPPPQQGGIDRGGPGTGKGERLYERSAEHTLSAPNDIVFDRQGGFWFTDFGRQAGRDAPPSGIYYAQPDGSKLEEVSFGSTGYNGVGLSPDERTVYAAETFTGRLVAFDLAAPGQVVKGGRGGRVIGAAPGRAFFDSLAVQANGDVCIASIADGITTMSPAGAVRQTPLPDRMVTNICFGGEDMRDAFITLSETGQPDPHALARTGPETELQRVSGAVEWRKGD